MVPSTTSADQILKICEEAKRVKSDSFGVLDPFRLMWADNTCGSRRTARRSGLCYHEACTCFLCLR